MAPNRLKARRLAVLATLLAFVCTIAAQAMPAQGAVPGSSVLFVDLTNGDDAADGNVADAPLKSVELALSSIDSAGGTIYVQGTSQDSCGVVIPQGVQLRIAGDTVFNRGNATSCSTTGISLESGASISTDSGATLTMSGWETAIHAKEGSLIGDGTYALTGNAVGAFFSGDVIASAKGALRITIDSTAGTLTGRGVLFRGSATFNNASVSIKGTPDTNDEGSYGGQNPTLSLTNTDFITEGVRFNIQGNHSLTMESSTLSVKGKFPKGGRMPYESFGVIANLPSSVNNSTITAEGAGVSFSTDITITNSALEIKNAEQGLNINYGANAIFDSSVLKMTNNVTSGKVGVGANSSANLTFTGDSVFDTPGAAVGSESTYDGVYCNSGSFVVTGGSHLTSYNGTWNYNSTTPTNGAGNGNERLTLFTLADPSVNELAPVNLTGDTYTYKVARASADGEKHVWVPAATVTFHLNADDAVRPAGARFSDGTSTSKTAKVMRGYAMNDASAVVGGAADAPENPSAPGYAFQGWFYKDGGVEKAFTPDSLIVADTVVYAKWETDASSYTVVYHSNYPGSDEVVVESFNSPDRSYTVLSHDQAVSINTAFNGGSGRTFVGWNIHADGSGAELTAGDVLTMDSAVNQLDVYAQWEDLMATVRFSANGGTFTSDSVFKTHPEVFDITTDSRGGEVATVKTQVNATQGVTLDAMLRSLGDGSVGVVANQGLATPASGTQLTSVATCPSHTMKSETTTVFIFTLTRYYWYEDPEATRSVSLTATGSSATKVTGDITYYLGWDFDGEVIQASDDLDGDLLQGDGVGADTRPITAGARSTNPSQPVPVIADDIFGITGTIDTTPVKNRIQQLAADFFGDSYTEADLASITLSEVDSSFTSTLTVPDELSLPDNLTALFSDNDLFKVDSVKKDGSTVTVTMVLKKNPATQYATLLALYEDVMSAPQLLELTVQGAAVDSQVGDETGFVVKGTVVGDFTGVASRNTTSKKYFFDWTAKQIDTGKTPLVLYLATPRKVTANVDLPADLLIGDDTQHDDVIHVTRGQGVAFTGLLEVSSIYGQIHGLAQRFILEQFGENFDPTNPTHVDILQKITLHNLASHFSTSITLPEGISLPDETRLKDAVFEGYGLFVLATPRLSDDKKTAIFDMVLTKAPLDYENFWQLYVDVASVAGPDSPNNALLTITMPGAIVDNDAPLDTYLTSIGVVEGDFKAVAKYPGSLISRSFYFTWNSMQMKDPDGTDSTQLGSPNVTLTVVVDEPPITPGDAPSAPQKPKVLAQTGAPVAALMSVSFLLACAGAVMYRGRKVHTPRH